jgi:predicted transcriptional regulator
LIHTPKTVVDNSDHEGLRRKPPTPSSPFALWSRGPSAVRQIAAVMDREAGYTTILKLLQIMTEKRLVVRDEAARTHIYEAAYTEDQTQRQLVTDLVDRVFDGSAAKLVLQALAATKASPEELDEIRKLLATKTGGSR